MKKGLLLLLIAVFISGIAYGAVSDLSVENLWNRVYNSTDRTIKIQSSGLSGVIVSGITTDSHASGVQPLTPDSVSVTSVSIIPLPTNALDVYIGSSTTASSIQGWRLTGDNVLILPINNVNDVYFSSGNNSDGVSWIGVQSN